MKSVMIIGGGITGLSAAYFLQKQADQSGVSLDIAILEQADYWGGKIRTDRVEGFVIEGGPDTFIATKPWAMELCRDLGLESRLFGTNPHQKNTYVLHQGKLKPLPDGLTMMIPTRFMPMLRTELLSWPEKLRMGMDFFIPAREDAPDESLGAFVSRRLGRAAYEKLIEPLMSGIYAGDGDQLSLKATFPILHELELQYGGLVKGALAMRKKSRPGHQNGRMAGTPSSQAGMAVPSRTDTSRSVFLTPKTGLAEIVEQLVARLNASGVDLRLKTRVTSIRKAGNGYRLELAEKKHIDADAIVLASPAFASGNLIANLDSELAGLLQETPYVTTATISLAYRQADLPRSLDGYGYVIPRREGRQALACTWTSTKFPHRAPESMALLRVFVGRAGQEEQIPSEEPELVQIARNELKLTLGITAQPVLTRTYIWERAMPQYNLGHPHRLRIIEELLSQLPGITLAGNGYGGIGIPDCIHSAETAAGQVWAYLNQQSESIA
jgi:oxygen-dependent protoporphyrinogen oxidase